MKETNMFKKVLEKSGHKCVWVLLLTALTSAACAGQVTQPQETLAKVEPTPTATRTGRGTGDTLRILNPQAPTILNPHLSAAFKDLEASRITYEPLASFNKEGDLVPFLAAEIPTLENGGVAADGKSVTWKLRQDVKWSDGEPFTADDVLFTYEFISNPEVKAATAATYQAVEGVELIDDYTVRVNFKGVNPAWALPFVGFQGMIIPRHVFEPYSGANAQEAPANVLPVGTGPYRVMPPGIKPQEVLLLGTQLVETNKIVFEPNPYFREPDKPFFRRVELRGGGTPGEAGRLVLQAGGVDYAYQLGQLAPEELVRLETGKQGQLVTNFGSNVERIILNRTDPDRVTADGERSSLQFPHPFFSDKKVRQAFAYAMDRNGIAALYGPTGRPATNNLVAPPQYNSPNTFYEFDLGKAAALLDEAGWIDTDGDGIRDKDGVKMEVVFQGKASAIVQKTQQIVRDALESIEVGVKLKIVDSSIMFSPGAANPDSAPRFNADMQEFSVRSPSPDPSAYMQYWTCARIPQKANNWSVFLNFERWCSSDYDALYEQSTTEIDPERRRQLFIQMNDMLIEDVVVIPMVYLADAQGVSQTIDGVDLTPWDTNTWNIKDWRRIP
jgi:peptide/nickel transport system substrate-binding protein